MERVGDDGDADTAMVALRRSGGQIFLMRTIVVTEEVFEMGDELIRRLALEYFGRARILWCRYSNNKLEGLDRR